MPEHADSGSSTTGVDLALVVLVAAPFLFVYFLVAHLLDQESPWGARLMYAALLAVAALSAGVATLVRYGHERTEDRARSHAAGIWLGLTSVVFVAASLSFGQLCRSVALGHGPALGGFAYRDTGWIEWSVYGLLTGLEGLLLDVLAVYRLDHVAGIEPTTLGARTIVLVYRTALQVLVLANLHFFRGLVSGRARWPGAVGRRLLTVALAVTAVLLLPFSPTVRREVARRTGIYEAGFERESFIGCLVPIGAVVVAGAIGLLVLRYWP